MKQILVAYATKTFTTKQYANEIAKHLETERAKVHVMQLSNEIDLDKYDVVVLGAPINGMSWMTEASQFVKQHEECLQSKKVFLFFVSYMHKHGRPMWKKLINKSMQSVAKTTNAIEVSGFGGKIDKAMPKPINWLFGMKGQPLDLINLEEAKQFATQIESNLKS